MNISIKEANRYLLNAKELLENKAIRENGSYLDSKYVKLAGHAAYTGVLLILDQLVSISSNESLSKSKRKSVEYYRSFLGKYDKKLLSEFNDLYTILHLALGYDGVVNARIVKSGMLMAKEFIEKVAARLN